jgi:trafficking protein particle complex subunit 5
LNEMGYRVGQRVLELIVWREKNSRRETRILGILQFIHTVVWRTLFGKAADSLEKSREHDDECTPSPPVPLPEILDVEGDLTMFWYVVGC